MADHEPVVSEAAAVQRDWVITGETVQKAARHVRYRPRAPQGHTPASPSPQWGRQADLFSPAGPEPDSRRLPDNIHHVEVTTQEVGMLSTDVDSIHTPSDLARLVADIKNHAQETMLAVVTNRDGRVLRVIRHSTGLISASQVSPLLIVAETTSIHGAATLHLAHNHPSGRPQPSQADKDITARIGDALDGTHIQLGFHAVIGADTFHAFGPDGETHGSLPAQAFSPGGRVAVTERRFKRHNPGHQIESKENAIELAKNQASDHAVLLLDQQHHHVGTVNLSAQDMLNLRQNGNASRLLGALHTTNASAIILKTDDRKAARNLIRFFNRRELDDIRLLDWINGEGANALATSPYTMLEKGPFFRLADDNVDSTPNALSRDEHMEYLAASAKGLDLSDSARRQRARAMGFDTGQVWYHGSPDTDLTEISEWRTSHGLFFARDPNTANYYAGDRGRLYEVYLKANNVADFDDFETFKNVAEESIDITETRDDEQARTFAERLFHDGYHKNATVKTFFDQLDGINDVLAREYDVGDLLSDLNVDAIDIEGLVKDIDKPTVSAAFEEDVPTIRPELEQAWEIYQSGSLDWYLNHQSDFLHGAQILGYDAVDMADPSSTGEPYSRVVFDPLQIRSVDAAFDPEFSEDSGLMLRMQEYQATEHSRAGINAAIRDFLKKVDLPVVGVSTPGQLPRTIQEHIATLNNGASRSRAVTHNGVIYLIKNNHTDADDVRKSLLHEGIVHYGLRRLFGTDEVDRLLDDIHAGLNDAQRRQLEVVAKREQIDLSKPENQRLATEEYIAYLAEQGIEQTPWQQLVAWFKNRLRDWGWLSRFTENRWSDNDINALLRKSYRHLRHQTALHQAGAVERRDGAPPRRLAAPRMMARLHGELPFDDWFERSQACHTDGQPVVAYRGQLGDASELRTHQGSLSFTDAVTASRYAGSSGGYVIPTHLVITRPLINTPDSPDLPGSVLVTALGAERARTIALCVGDEIQATVSWRQHYAADYSSPAELLKVRPGTIAHMSIPARAVFDNVAAVCWLDQAGFDGAIYAAPHGDSPTSVPEYRIFNTQQARSLFHPQQSYSPRDTDRATTGGVSDLGYFSALYRAVQALPPKQDKGTPTQMRAMLKNAGVKDEELAWTGLDAYLAAQTGRVSRGQIVEFVANNGVQVVEVAKGHGRADLADLRRQLDELNATPTEKDVEITEGYCLDPDIEWVEQEAKQLMEDDLYDDYDDACQHAMESAMEQAPVQYELLLNGQTTRLCIYADSINPNYYWLASNVHLGDYRSLEKAKDAALDVLHRRGHILWSDDRDDQCEELEERIERGGAVYEDFTLSGGTNYRELLLVWNRPTPWAAVEHAWTVSGLRGEHEERYPGTDPTPFKQWLVQAATGDYEYLERMDCGKLLSRLFDRETLTQAYRLIEKAAAPVGDFVEEEHWDEANIVAHVRLTDRVGVNGETILLIEELQSDWHQQGHQNGYRSGEQTNHSATVPDAPFKGNGWVELMLKRMLRIAAEQGYDQVAWTPGGVQAGLNSLSGYLDTLDWGYLTDSDCYRLIGKKNGNSLLKKEDIPANQLHKWVGRDIAARIERREGVTKQTAALTRGTIKEDALTFDHSHGMVAFYDRLVPNAWKKIARRLDKSATVTQAPLPGAYDHRLCREWRISKQHDAEEWVLVNQKDNRRYPFPTYEAALAALIDSAQLQPATVWTAPITPAMRIGVLKQGQPLFRLADDGPDDKPANPSVAVMVDLDERRDHWRLDRNDPATGTPTRWSVVRTG